MFERYVIGDAGFRNVTEAGRTKGFELQVRIPYYRGLGLSMVEGFDVTVDGVSYPRERNLFTVRGRTFPFEQMETEYTERWEMGEFATVTVPVDGGLKPGEHTIDAVVHLRVSYLPFPSITKVEKTLVLKA